MYCVNDGCKVVGLLKNFKVCPQCRSARYCSSACQTEDWTAGGHKAACGTAASKVSQSALARMLTNMGDSMSETEEEEKEDEDEDEEEEEDANEDSDEDSGDSEDSEDAEEDSDEAA